MTQEEKAKAYDEALEKAKIELQADLHESGVWAVTYLGLEKQKNSGNDNDRMSWNYDNEEDDYSDNDSNDEEEDEK